MCLRKGSGALKFKGGVQLAVGPASPGSEGNGGAKGDVDGGCIERSDGAEVIEPVPSMSRVVPLVYYHYQETKDVSGWQYSIAVKTHHTT